MTKLKTKNIKGKEYVEVHTRVKYFRENHPGCGISTEVLSMTDKRVVIKASITDEKGLTVATGIAYEDHGNSQVNRTSFIENCETSAIGRALGFFGIGIDAGIASANEVEQAVYSDYVKAIDYCLSKGVKKEQILGVMRSFFQ